MQTLEVAANHAVVRLTGQELMMVNNALNEVCHGINVPEFSTRIGAQQEEVAEVLRQINGLITLIEKKVDDSPGSSG